MIAPLWTRLVLVVAAVVLGAGVLSVGPAHAADAVASYAVEATVLPDGTLAVRATITAEGSPAQVTQRFATKQRMPDGSDLVRTLDFGGRDVVVDGDDRVVTVPFTGSQPAVLEYRVRGAAVGTGDTTTVAWRALQGLDLPVRSFDAVVAVPGHFTFVDCAAGDPANPGACGWYAGGTHEQQTPTFHDGPRAAGEIVEFVVRLPADVVAANDVRVQPWSLDRALSVAPVPLGVAAVLAFAGLAGLWAGHRRFGRDAAHTAPVLVGSFQPAGPGISTFNLTGDVRPGEVGTLVDERVDPIDVTASVIDLAVRNHLRITQLARVSPFAPTEWVFSRQESAAALLPYEKALLDAIAPASGQRRLSEIGPELAAALPAVQAGLYDEVVRKGWFAARPDATRGRWQRMGWIALAVAAIAAVLLVAFTSFGLAGLVLVGLASAIGPVGQAMPARTAKGSAVLAGLELLRGTLATQPTDEMPPGREHEELASVLPYAIVLGGAERWIEGLASANDASIPDETELSWYHGPSGWRLADLPDSLRSFIRAFEGTAVAR